MLESLVAGLLNRTLGNYVENFDPKQLNIGIWSGDVTLKNLKLKKESLDSLELPIDVSYGFLGQLTLQIPWSNLRGKPVKIIIEDAFLVATPMLIEQYDEEKIRQRELALKKKKLQDLELMEYNKARIDEDNNDNTTDQSKKQESFTESLLTKIVDNLQVTIKNIHIRYEDASVFTSVPYSVGVTLDELSAVSTDGSWVPNFVNLTNSFARKLLTLKSLSCYFNSYSNSLIKQDEIIDDEELIERFRQLIAKESNNDNEVFKHHNFILQPVTGNGKITINKLGTTETDPHILSELFFKEFSVNLDSDQYRDILNTASNYRFYAKTFKFKKFRPPKHMTPSTHPKEWFQYAGKVVLEEIHEKNYKWSWDYFKKRRDSRKAYIKVFKQKLTSEMKGEVVSPDLLQEVEKIEEDISYEDIKFFRSLARTQLRKEKITIKPVDNTTSEADNVESNPNELSSQAPSPDPNANKGWFSGWWGAPQPNTSTDASDENDENDDLVMSEEQKKEFFEAIEFDEQQAIVDAIDIPKDRIKLKLFASLEKGSFRIKNKSKSLAEVMWEGCNFQFFERPHSYLSKFTLQEFKVEDSEDSNTIYKHIVSIKSLQQHMYDSKSSIESTDDEQEPFFQLSFESNPLDESADSKLMAKLKSMTIFYHAGFVEKVVKFFTPPKQHQDTISAIMNAAEATVEGLTTQTKLGLRYALDEHKTVNTQLDLQAPLIILPLDPGDWNAPCGIIDAGHISVMSDLIDKNKALELKSKPPKEFNDSDWGKLTELMYDKFNLHLHDSQLLIGPTMKSTIKQLHEEENDGNTDELPPALIMKNFDTDFLLQISILPNAYNLAKFKVSGNVPSIKAKMSDYQYKVILKLFKIIIPVFDSVGFDDIQYGSPEFDSDTDSLIDMFHNSVDSEFSDALSFIEDSDDEKDNDNSELKNKLSSVYMHPLTSPRDSREGSLSPRPSSSGTPMSNPLQDKQHQFDFDFKVGVVELSLLKCTLSRFDPPESMVDLICENFELSFFKTAKEVQVDILLSDVNLVDEVEKGGSDEYKKIVSSNNFTESDNLEYGQDKKEDLVKVSYSRTQRLVELNNEVIELYDSDVKLDIAAVKAVVNRKSLLTIYTYIMTTFTDPNSEESPADQLRHNDEDNVEGAPQTMNVTIGLERIILVLTDDHVRLATLQLRTGEIGVLLLPEKMRVQFKLGALTVHDDVNEGSPRDSVSRRLVSIDDNDLAEVSYETFDPASNPNLFSSKIKFKTGSMRINLVEEPCRNILGYFMNFLKMKGLFDSARDSNYSKISADQVKVNNSNNRMSYDVLIKTPIIVFPKLGGSNIENYDAVTAYLGEIRASNSFTKVENKSGEILSKIVATLSSTRLTSDIYFDGKKQFLEIIDGIDMEFNIDNGYSDPRIDLTRASSIITAKMSNSEVRLTEFQLQYLMKLIQTVPSVVQYDDEISMLKQIEEDAIKASLTVSPSSDESSPENVTSKELFHDEDCGSVTIDDNHDKLDFKFKVGEISLSIYNETKGVYDNLGIKEKRLSRFSLNDIEIDLKMKESSSYVSNIRVRAFTVEDIRLHKENLFTEIIPTVNHDNYQFMCQVTSQKDDNNENLIFMLKVDSPKMILALDYLFSLRDYINEGLGLNKISEVSDGESEEEGSELIKKEEETQLEQSTKKMGDVQPSKRRFSYSISIIDFSVILLSDPTVNDTEAIVLKLEQLVVSSQDITTYIANNVGSFLCKMNDFEGSRLRIIDDFSASFSLDPRNSTSTKLLNNIQLSVDHLILRLSLSDIRLAIKIINKAYELAGIRPNMTDVSIEENNGYTSFTKEFKKKISNNLYASSTYSENSVELVKAEDIIKAESLSADFAGFRLVILGNVHELPVIDMNIKPFFVRAKNWSNNLDLSTQIQSYVNVFNYAKSSWEPLLEPWQVGLNISKTSNNNKSSDTFNVNIVSREIAEVTLTSRTISLLSQMYSLVSLDSVIGPRGENAPYIILNQTGYELNIWIENENKDDKARKNLTSVKQNHSIPWQFEDWTVIREKLDVDSQMNSIAVEFVNSPYKVVESISLVGEGEELFKLYPAIQGVHNRLACSITLGEDNVKRIILKSTMTVKNTAAVSILVGVGLSSENGVNETYPIAAGEEFSMPIDRVYKEALAIKPDIPGSNYSWSSSRIAWKSLFKHSSLLKCIDTVDKEKADPFYFQVNGENLSEKNSRIYPHLNVVVSSPLQVENLLPFDSSLRIYDKTIRDYWDYDISKGKSLSIHNVNISDLLLLSVTPLNCGFSKRSDYSIIHSPEQSGLPKDYRLELNHDDGQKLHLNIEYNESKDEFGGGIKLSIYSPYVVLNRTGENLLLAEKFNTLHSIATHSLEDPTKMKSSQPKMFSFENDNDISNRAYLCVSDSNWSREISLDAIGQFFDLSMPANGNQSEINVGVDITEGEGKYLNTKVVTISPRFIFSNNLSEEVNINEIGSTRNLTIKPGESLPLIQTCTGMDKELRIRFLGSTSKWSSPFSIKDIGEIYLKILKQGTGHMLLKVIVLLENATLFIRIEDAKDHWPYSIRNFSNTEFVFYQSNPYIDEQGTPVKRQNHFKPLFYRIPPKSVMPYAWDYPAGVVKELVLRSHGKDQGIQLAEIGNIGVVHLPPSKNLPATAVDINIVADGPTQALVISDSDPSNIYQESRNSSSTALSSIKQAEIAEDEGEDYSMRIAVNFKGMGLSLITSDLKELCYITFRGFEVKYNESDIYQTLIWNLKWLQIDNQLFESIYPIVVYPSVVPQSNQEVESHPTFHFSVSRVKDYSHGVLYIKYATVLLQELTLDIDEDFSIAFKKFIDVSLKANDKKAPDVLCEEIIELPEPSEATVGQDIYFEALHLQPTQINLSFLKSSEVDPHEKSDKKDYVSVDLLVNILSMAMANVNDAPIKLNSLFIENIRVPIPILLHSIKTHYKQDFIYQVHKVIGSADFLGNPVGLFNNISSGVMDIFYEPYQGLIMNDRPQELGISIAKGGLSFLKKSVFGFSDSMAKITGSVAKGLSFATLDEEFQQKRRHNLRRNKPQHALVGFKSGATSFIDSLTSGVSGIALAPIEGASKDGAAGFFKGIGKGLIGLPTKAAIGAFDLASNVSEGIRNTTTVFDNNALERVRLPRVINYDGITRPYSQEESQGQYWLKVVNGGEFATTERYLAHMILPGGELVFMITFRNIMLINIADQEVKWKIEFSEIKSIILESTGIKIYLFDNRQGPFIPLPDVKSKKHLYNRIAIAVNQYNKEFESTL